MSLTRWRWPLVATVGVSHFAPHVRCKAASERTPASSMKKISAPDRLHEQRSILPGSASLAASSTLAAAPTQMARARRALRAEARRLHV
jgi:hypothetical protein